MSHGAEAMGKGKGFTLVFIHLCACSFDDFSNGFRYVTGKDHNSLPITAPPGKPGVTNYIFPKMEVISSVPRFHFPLLCFAL